MQGAIEMLRKNSLLRENDVLLATGGGAHKFAQQITDSFHLQVVKGDELSCLLAGLNFMLQHTEHECYYLCTPERPIQSHVSPYDINGLAPVFPYLLVNIGSGVSILKVDGNMVYQRVSGTPIGGGTYWGLCRLLTKYNSFHEATRMAESGHPNNVNMLVG